MSPSAFNNLLFVCTGNICRSPMAAELWRDRMKARGSEVVVASAGIGAVVGAPAEEQAHSVMNEWGIDLSGHRARQIDLGGAASHDLILVMEPYQKTWIEGRMPALRGRVQLLGRWIGEEDIPDPYKGPMSHFREVRDLIARATDAWLERLPG